MRLIIPRCYDSHVHLIPTGEMKSVMNLRSVSTLADFAKMIIPSSARRGHWVIGFGWESWNFDFTGKDFRNIHPDSCLALSRRDGHALWMNRAAMEELRFWKKREDWSADLAPYVHFDPQGWPTGLVFDRVHEKVLDALPPHNPKEMRAFATQGIEEFRQAGFTHLREMMATPQIWSTLSQMDADEELGAYVEVNFHCPNIKALSETIDTFLRARAQESSHLRAAGIKIFVDGAMGSEGALLCAPYEKSSHRGFRLWDSEELTAALIECWAEGIPVAVHAIGDLAVKLTLQAARKASYALKRRQLFPAPLHLEHLQMLDLQDEAGLLELSVTAHFQPVHFFQSRDRLKDQLGERWRRTFPWVRFEKLGLPFFFGSDSPVASPSLRGTCEALKASEEFGLGHLQMDWTYPHTHPEKNWGQNCRTEILADGGVSAVWFDGKRVI